MTRQVAVGVVGFGFSAKIFHLPFLFGMEEYVVKGVSTSKDAGEVRRELGERGNGVEVYATAEELIGSEGIELVVITAPNDVHHRLCKAALEKGKHVVVEKPMTITSGEARELAELGEAKGLVVSCYHNRRWDGDFMTVREGVEGLGEVRVFESRFDRYRPEVRDRWRERPGAGAGNLYDLGSHLVDQALVLFGTPERVTGVAKPIRDGSEAVDYFHMTLHYPRCEVVLSASPYCAGPNRRYHIESERGTYEITGVDPQEKQLIDGVPHTDPTFGAGREGTLYTEGGARPVPTAKGSYATYYRELHAAITQGGPVPVPAVEAARVIHILELVMQSTAEGKTVAVDF